ncbi:MAG: NAD-dependent deacylase [Fretibacterium sp.]|nr:NAD-dependent deacylase [Fretibacterium sp.]
MKKKLVVLTGAGMSAESGIKTFRDTGGLWEEYDVMEVASIDGWRRNPTLMTEFYNQRRAQLEHAQPNRGHVALAELEEMFDVRIVTQNVDNLHERAGSTHVLHLHGELTKVRSVLDESKVQDIGYRKMEPGEKGPDGAPLRPHIVWFGEAVPLIGEAAHLVREADIFAVIGTSLNVYPAAGLVGDLRPGRPAFLIDPNEVAMTLPGFTIIREGAAKGVDTMREHLLKLI